MTRSFLTVLATLVALPSLALADEARTLRQEWVASARCRFGAESGSGDPRHILDMPQRSPGPEAARSGSGRSDSFLTECHRNGVDFGVGGSFFTRYETRRNYGIAPHPADSVDLVRYRARLALTAGMEVSEGFDMTARFVPQTGGLLGIGGDDLVDATLGLHEGAIILSGAGFRVDVGRFEMSYGDELVIGTVGWDAVGRAFDGVRAHGVFGKDGPWLDVFVTLLLEGLALPTPVGTDFAAGDQYFVGAYAGLGPLLGEGFDLDLYVLARLFPKTDEGTVQSPETNEVTIGARSKAVVGGLLDYRVEAGVQLGKRGGADVLAFQADGEVGVGFLDKRAFRVAAEGFFASGDDPATANDDEGWNQLFPTAHKWLGTMDVIGPRSNVAGAACHVSYAIIPAVKVTVDGQAFFRPEKVGAVDGYTGTEVDTGVLWTPGKVLALRAAYDIFVPDESFKPDLLHFVEVELRATF